jgi:hypothetical protein
MDRIDTIFCKMLKYNPISLGCTDSPYTLTKSILQRGLIAKQPPIMAHLREFIQNSTENRMVVWTDKYGNTWAVMNTDRTSLDGSRRIDWVECKAKTCMPGIMTSTMKNPIWVTTYRQA